MTNLGTETATAVPSHHGKVKWFSKDKGYGFITDGNDKDYYFSIKDVIGQEIPTIRSSVSFYSKHNEKGYQATSIRIQQELDKNINSYVSCLRCNKKMVPRIVFAHGCPHHSVCPFCANTYKKFMSPWKSIILSILSII